MTKISTTAKSLNEVPQKYCRIVLSEKPSTWHRLVEKADGSLEYHMGAGKRKSMTPRTFRTLVRTIIQSAKAHQLEYVAIHIDAIDCPKLEAMGGEWLQRTLAENLQLATYEFTTYKTKKKDTKELKEILVCGELSTKEEKAFNTGLIVSEAINEIRELSNLPAHDITPTTLGQRTRSIFKNTAATVKVLGEPELKKLGMNALLAVGQGTKEETKLITIEYWGAGKDAKQKPIVLVGKGITFDTGGLNVKPTGFMHEEYMDMVGGAAVIGALAAAAKLKLKKNVVGVIASAENSISDTSMRPSDIVRAMNGTTVEIMHTDAEGRLALADAMVYARKFNPRVMIDIAGLTGAALSALGQHASAIMTKNSSLQKTMMEIGEDTGDYVWPLPLWDEYKQHIKSSRADIANISPSFSRYGGCIEGGIFLSYFAPLKTPWVHIDTAPKRMAVKQDHLSHGFTGEPVRLLVKLIETYK